MIAAKLIQPASGMDKEILKDLFFLKTELEDNKPTKPHENSDKDDETMPSEIDILKKEI